MNFEKSDQYRQIIHRLIPGGCHTYSKGDDQWPELSPAAMKKGEGCYLWDIDNNKFLDCSMGLTSVSLGHAYPDVIQRITDELKNGVNFQRPAQLELEVAEKLVSIIPGHDMVKFTKNGSTATTAAVKLARGATNRKMVAFPIEQPFFSYDDWFIETTECNKGTVRSGLSLTYSCADLKTLEKLFEEHPDQIACVISEPYRNIPMEENYLEKVIQICHKNGALFIQDEMVTGFKAGLPGYIVNNKTAPDLATWGKGIANGFSFCAISGKEEYMQQGGITNAGEEKLFLTSSTHGAETTALAAFLSTVEVFEKQNVLDHNHKIGQLLLERAARAIQGKGLEKFVQVKGSNWMQSFTFLNKELEVDLAMRTLLMQEMIKNGVLFQGSFVPCFSHQNEDINLFIQAFENSLKTYTIALEEGVEKYLIGQPIKPVFRKYT